MSILSWFQTTEADVVALIGKIKSDVAVAEADAVKALDWIGGEVPNIVAALQTAVGLASAVGVVTAPELAAASAAVAALQAFGALQSTDAGSVAGQTKAVVAGYVAYQNANAAVSAAKAAAAAAPVAPKLPAPSAA